MIKKFKTQKLSGFTFVELIVIIGILVILVAISIPTLLFFQNESDLNNSAEETINTLRFAQNKKVLRFTKSIWLVEDQR